jgi:16S rRNA (guanine966-N2)-methyltransferase
MSIFLRALDFLAMRITGGSLRGRKIKAPSGPHVEPVPDMVREAVFSILQHLIPRATVLDLFACSGSLGIEALSRGAASVLFVEKDENASRVILENLESLKIAGKVKVIMSDALNITSHREVLDKGFDLVFIDPPYRLSDTPESFTLLERLITGIFARFINPEGIAVFRQRRGGGTVLAGREGFRLDARTYGTTQVTFIEFSPQRHRGTENL